MALPATRRQVRDNLRRVLGERAVDLEWRDTKRTFMNYAACLAETLALDRQQGRSLRVRVHGEAKLAGVLEGDRGAVLVTAHVGPFEAAARQLATQFGVEVMLVMAREPDERARRYHDRLRSREGLRVAHVGEHQTDSLPILRHLRANGVAALQLDRPGETGRTLRTTLFGVEQRVPEGPFQLAGLARVPLISVFASREGVFDYTLRIGAPLELSRKPGAEELARAANTVVREMERAIKRDPTQWFHFEAVDGDPGTVL